MVNYTAIANNGIRKSTENLDSFDELQNFMNKMESKGFLNVEVTGHSIITGAVKTICYSWTGVEWEKLKIKSFNL